MRNNTAGDRSEFRTLAVRLLLIIIIYYCYYYRRYIVVRTAARPDRGPEDIRLARYTANTLRPGLLRLFI